MVAKRKPEGLEIVLSQVLVVVLTVVTVVPLLAFLNLDNPTNELGVGTIVFAAWFVIVSMVTPVVQKRYGESERPR